MRNMAKLLCSFMFVALTLCDQSTAQTFTLPDAVVQQDLTQLIADLQSKALRQSQGDQTAYYPQGPINPTLGVLGAPLQVVPSTPAFAEGLLHYNARVIHSAGTSVDFRPDADGTNCGLHFLDITHKCTTAAKHSCT